MSEDMEHMSKYARKKAARREESVSHDRTIADRTLAAIDFALRLTEGRAVVKPNVKKPKQPPPEPRGAVADLHGLPEQCSMLLRNAASQLRTALKLAYSIQDEAKKGRQAGEAYAVVGIIGQLPDKIEYAATRVAAIPNKRNGQDG